MSALEYLHVSLISQVSLRGRWLIHSGALGRSVILKYTFKRCTKVLSTLDPEYMDVVGINLLEKITSSLTACM